MYSSHSRVEASKKSSMGLGLLLLRPWRNESCSRPVPLLRNRTMPKLHHSSSHCSFSKRRSRYPRRNSPRRLISTPGVRSLIIPRVPCFLEHARKRCVKGNGISCNDLLDFRFRVLTGVKRKNQFLWKLKFWVMFLPIYVSAQLLQSQI